MQAFNPDDIQALSALLDRSARVVLITHTHPDGDALGSSTGMQRFLSSLGKESTVIIPDPIPETLTFIRKDEKLPLIAASVEMERAEEAISAADLIICLDLNHIRRAEGLEPAFRASEAKKVLIDHHIGPDTDVPAGDLGVGGREIGYLFGQYKRLANEWTGVLTGKGLSFGGSLIRPEATGYGDVYFAENMLAMRKETFEGKKCVISGSGNVASYAAEKLMQLGAKVLTLSDRSGTILAKDGITEKMLQDIMVLKTVKRGELAEFAKKTKAVKFFAGVNSWQVTDKIDAAFPCARQNELNGKDAEYLLKHGCTLVGEGANMPSTPDAIEAFVKAKIMYSPGKASNAGGVATSGLEMSQNSERLSWTREEVDAKLKGIMKSIHDNAWEAAAKYGKKGNYVVGANIAGFTKVADAMVAQGVC